MVNETLFPVRFKTAPMSRLCLGCCAEGIARLRGAESKTNWRSESPPVGGRTQKNFNRSESTLGKIQEAEAIRLNPLVDLDIKIQESMIFCCCQRMRWQGQS